MNPRDQHRPAFFGLAMFALSFSLLIWWMLN